MVAKNLINSLSKECGIDDCKELKTFKGSDFEGTICSHPFEKMKFD